MWLWVQMAWAGALVGIPGGSYEPLYPPDPDRPVVEVAAFRLDDAPVTAGEFHRFVEDHPDWSRERISPCSRMGATCHTDARRTNPSPTSAGSPRGPTVRPRASGFPPRTSGSTWPGPRPRRWTRARDPERLRLLLDWYSRPSDGTLATVRTRAANAYGIHDMHGLVWEWVEDFNNTLFGTDGREGGDAEVLRFCGSGTLSATDVTDYARFMRVAFRSSLKGSYTTPSLGFAVRQTPRPSRRCADASTRLLFLFACADTQDNPVHSEISSRHRFRRTRYTPSTCR